MVVPTSVIERDEGDARFYQTSCKKRLLAKSGATIGIADSTGFALYRKGALGGGGIHKRNGLLKVLVHANGGIACRTIVVAFHLVQTAAQIAPTQSTAVRQFP